MSLTDKYSDAILIAVKRFNGAIAREEDGKLHFRGTVQSEADRNAIWKAITSIPEWHNDIVADIKVAGGGVSDWHRVEKSLAASQLAISQSSDSAGDVKGRLELTETEILEALSLSESIQRETARTVERVRELTATFDAISLQLQTATERLRASRKDA